MASNSSSVPMVWASPDLIAALPLVSPFAPVRRWDQAAGGFANEQDTDDQGRPIWQAEAMLRMGWGASNTTVRVRYAGSNCPTIQPDPAKVVAAMGMTLPGASSSSAPASAPSRLASTRGA